MLRVLPVQSALRLAHMYCAVTGKVCMQMAEEDVRPLAEALRRMTALTCLDLRMASSHGTLTFDVVTRFVAELQQVSYVRRRRLRLIHSNWFYQHTPDDHVNDALAEMNVELVRDSRGGEHL